MSGCLDCASLRFEGLYGGTGIYSLESASLINKYYVVSGVGSRELLAFPEVIGFRCYNALVDETAAALKYLIDKGFRGGFDIFTILRGGLNYPLEEAAYLTGIKVPDMHFVSCERVIRDHVILGLEMNYQKVTPKKDTVLAIGDILATGDTLRLCLNHMADIFHQGGGSLRRVIFFTIGGTRGIDLLEELTVRFRELFPGFEGFDCFFYEGIFTVYDGPGASGINTRNIDFGWKGGAVSPEFRRFILDHPDALLEKCIIYDGGARRYEIPLHFEEVLEYWEGIRSRAGVIDTLALVREKLGYDGPVDFDKWLDVTYLRGIEGLEDIWAGEKSLLENLPDLKALSERRIAAISNLKKQYETR